MSDIFISYSSKDRAQAEQLTELLASAGLSVWIDKQGIGAATSWSKEIVDAIDECKALVVLLSPSSIASKNVAKEIAIAAERNKKILPLDLEPVTLPNEIAYHLAGLQRTEMTNIDAIIRALGKLGLEATQAPTLKLVKETDGRKSLMILPFEDLSPTGDNGWFTDGIASELVSSLSHIKALKLIDWNTSRMLRERKVKTIEIANEFGVRFFIEGQVRKFGDQVKISVTLLDIETADHLWQDSFKGTMEDIFAIQETVARNVVNGLNIILSKDEEKRIDNKPTENVEAYELWLKGKEYHDRYTKKDFEHALSLFEESARLDPQYSQAFSGIAVVSQAIYRLYLREPQWLERAESATENIKRIDGESKEYLWSKTANTLLRGDAKRALEYAKQVVQLDPTFYLGYDVLGYAYKALGMKKEMAEAWEEEVRLKDNQTTSTFNFLVALSELDDTTRLQTTAEKAIPLFERHIRLNPDDYWTQVHFAIILSFAGRNESALELADRLSAIPSIDDSTIYNLACVYIRCGALENGLETLKRAVRNGIKNIETFRTDPDLAPLRGTPAFEELMKELSEP